MTETTQQRHWLHQISKPQEAWRDTVSHRMRRQPLAVSDGEQVWSVATDAKLLVAILGAAPGIREAEADEALAVLSFLRRDIVFQHQCSLAALKAWCGEPVRVAPCPVCGTLTGEQRSSMHCYRCDDMTETEPRRDGYLFGHQINRNLLAQGLEHFGGYAVRIHIGSKADDPLVLEGADWRVWLMPLVGTLEATAPRFPVETGQ